METKPVCSECGAEISLTAPRGLCTRCLFSLALFPGEETGSLTAATFVPSSGRPGAGERLRYFGDYELLEEIARGGMGIVFKARQVSLNRVVALKAILSGQLASRAERERFRKEAEGAASLQHPNIVAIHEIGHHQEQSYFSMDFVEGRTLAEVIRTEQITPARAAGYLKKIAEAVHYAHAKGILHRDLKPQNILLDQFDQPRITDFGLAKRMNDDLGLTKSHDLLGTPQYMAPEQATGQTEKIGPATDIYGLGAMLYHLLTGKPPFAGATPLETLRLVVETEPVAPLRLKPSIPVDLQSICLKCLEKDPARRYASAQDLASDLERFLNHEPVLAKPAPWWRQVWSWSLRRPWALCGAASVVILCLIGFTYDLWQENAYLRWTQSHPGQKPVQPNGWFDRDMAGIALFAVGPFLPILPWLGFMLRRGRNELVERRHILAYALAGIIQIGFGIFLVTKQIEASTWHYRLWHRDATVLGGGFYFTAVGLLLLLEIARHQTSALAGLTTHPFPAARTRSRNILREIFHAFGVSSDEWRIAPLAMLFLGGPIWLLAGPGPHLPEGGLWELARALGKLVPALLAIWLALEGRARLALPVCLLATAGVIFGLGITGEREWAARNMIWFPLMLTGPELPVVLALAGRAKASARLFWILGIGPIAGLSTIKDFGSMRSLSFESWMLATFLGLIILRLAQKPAGGKSSAAGELLTLGAAWASMAAFFLLAVPEFPKNHQSLGVMAGLGIVGALGAGIWSLSLQQYSRRALITLGLVIGLSLWVILFSPARL